MQSTKGLFILFNLANIGSYFKQVYASQTSAKKCHILCKNRGDVVKLLKKYSGVLSTCLHDSNALRFCFLTYLSFLQKTKFNDWQKLSKITTKKLWRYFETGLKCECSANESFLYLFQKVITYCNIFNNFNDYYLSFTLWATVNAGKKNEFFLCPQTKSYIQNRHFKIQYIFMYHRQNGKEIHNIFIQIEMFLFEIYTVFYSYWNALK